MNQFFRYSVDVKFAPMWLPFGVRPSKDGVTITDDSRFLATFGFLRLETPLGNVTGAHITRDYRWWTAIGARASFADDGLSLGTNTGRESAFISRRRSHHDSAATDTRRSRHRGRPRWARPGAEPLRSCRLFC